MESQKISLEKTSKESSLEGHKATISQTSKIGGITFLLLLVAAGFFKIRYVVSSDFDLDQIFIMNQFYDNFYQVSDLTWLDGLINPLLILGKTLIDIFVKTTVNVLDKLDHSFVINIIVFIFRFAFGIVWNTLLAIPRYFKNWFIFLTQSAHWSYYVAFMFSTFASWGILSQVQD